MKPPSLETLQRTSIYIAQGEFAIGTAQNPVISTILGSCVASCLWDPSARLGGMNHFLLPDGPDLSRSLSSFGANAMELLINALIGAGADRRLLRAKVFGGAEMYRGLTNAGRTNGEFVLQYLEYEKIPCDAHSLGGSQARRVEFNSRNGKARQKMVADVPLVEVVPKVDGHLDLELF